MNVGVAETFVELFGGERSDGCPGLCARDDALNATRSNDKTSILRFMISPLFMIVNYHLTYKALPATAKTLFRVCEISVILLL